MFAAYTEPPTNIDSKENKEFRKYAKLMRSGLVDHC